MNNKTATDTDKSNIKEIEENVTKSPIPQVIPAYAHDTGNYIAKYGMANFQIQFVMNMDGRLDFDKLVKAVRISADAEPVMGCRFVKNDPPYWERFKDIDEPNKFCSIEETVDPDKGVKRFLQEPMKMDTDPMMLLRIIRSESSDTLVVKINHVVCDGAGARDYVLLLADIYSHLEAGDDTYPSQVSVRDRKDFDELKIAFSNESPRTSWSILQQVPSSSWNFPWKNMLMGETRFAINRLPFGQLDLMSTYAKGRNATINDLILTAVFRAMFKISKPPYGIPMDIPITIDLRKYLPDHEADAIRNLSGGIVIKIGRMPHESFEETLSRVAVYTRDMRAKHPSVMNLFWADYVESLSFRQICGYYKFVSKILDFTSLNPLFTIGRGGPALSNCGIISKSLIHFGKNTVTDAYIIPPAIRAPGILIVASSYNGILTLGVGYYKSSVHKADMENLLDRVKKELLDNCK